MHATHLSALSSLWVWIEDKECAQLTHTSQLRDFALCLIVSQRGYVTRGDESPELGL